MKRPIESDYTSQVAYTRALEEYCDTLAQPQQDEDRFCDANCVWTDHHPDCKLAQPEQKPVAWAMLHDNGHFIDAIHPDEHLRVEGEYTHPLYTKEQL